MYSVQCIDIADNEDLGVELLFLYMTNRIQMVPTIELNVTSSTFFRNIIIVTDILESLKENQLCNDFVDLWTLER